MTQSKGNLHLSVVIPIYNEEKRLKASLKSLYDYFIEQDYSYEILISDDGSTDASLEIVKTFQKNWKEIRLLENSHKGKAPTIISGINHSEGKYVLFTDVDLSVPINELSKFMVWVENEGFDLVIATREGPGANRIGEPLTRHLMGRVFNIIVQMLVLPGINDTQCGFKLFKTSQAKKIFEKTKLYSVNDPDIKGAKVSGFDVELLYVAKSLGYKIKEVPVTWIYGDNSTVHSLKDSYYNFADVCKVRYYSMKGYYSK